MYREIITEPTVEPVSLPEAKTHLIVEHDDDDALIAQMIIAARRHAEMRTNRAIVRQKWRLYLDYEFNAFKLVPGSQEVESIQYLDTDGATQTLAASVYTVDIPRQQVYLAYAQTWPATRWVRNAVWADIWAGFYKASESPVNVLEHIPADLNYAMLLMIGDLYEHRESNAEMVLHPNSTYDALLAAHVVYEDR